MKIHVLHKSNIYTADVVIFGKKKELGYDRDSIKCLTVGCKMLTKKLRAKSQLLTYT